MSGRMSRSCLGIGVWMLLGIIITPSLKLRRPRVPKELDRKSSSSLLGLFQVARCRLSVALLLVWYYCCDRHDVRRLVSSIDGSCRSRCPGVSQLQYHCNNKISSNNNNNNHLTRPSHLIDKSLSVLQKQHPIWLAKNRYWEVQQLSPPHPTLVFWM